MNINIDNFLTVLPYMFKGMFGIFAVTLVIVIVTVFLNKIITKK